MVVIIHSISFTGQELLTVNELYRVLNELHGVRAKWRFLGVSLRVKESTLAAIGVQFHDSSDCLREMLSHWLTLFFDYLPHWSAIVAALRMPIVDEPQLAQILEAKYCSGMCTTIFTNEVIQCQVTNFMRQ